jgi:hypothetical protein
MARDLRKVFTLEPPVALVVLNMLRKIKKQIFDHNSITAV